MSSKTLSLYSQQPNGVTYADTTDPDYTVRFKTTSAPKTLDGVMTTNYVTEIIYNDLNSITVAAKQVNDALSVRLKVSGALESQDQLKQILKDLADQISTWASESVLIGFNPSTAPVRDHDL